jgi:hypothetical protein
MKRLYDPSKLPNNSPHNRASHSRRPKFLTGNPLGKISHYHKATVL